MCFHNGESQLSRHQRGPGVALSVLNSGTPHVVLLLRRSVSHPALPLQKHGQSNWMQCLTASNQTRRLNSSLQEARGTGGQHE